MRVLDGGMECVPDPANERVIITTHLKFEICSKDKLNILATEVISCSRMFKNPGPQLDMAIASIFRRDSKMTLVAVDEMRKAGLESFPEP